MRLRSHIVLYSLIVVSGCASNTSIKVNSNPPDAEVYMKTMNQNERQLVGKTPLVQESIEAVLKTKPQGPLYIEIEKADYIPSTILVTEVGSGSIEISRELKPLQKKEASAEGQNSKEANQEKLLSLNKGLEQLFEAQRLARVGRLDDALKTLDEAGKLLPQVSPIYEMRGGIYYIQKDYRKALDEYQKALVVNEDNPSTIKMIQRLNGQLGIQSNTSQQKTEPKQ